jgi:hypothetical protein
MERHTVPLSFHEVGKAGAAKTSFTAEPGTTGTYAITQYFLYSLYVRCIPLHIFGSDIVILQSCLIIICSRIWPWKVTKNILIYIQGVYTLLINIWEVLASLNDVDGL